MVCDGDDEGQAEVLVAPYVQSVTTNDAWILWETASGDGSRVEFGPTEALGLAACGAVAPMFDGVPLGEDQTRVHEVQLTGLLPDTTVWYRVRTGETTSPVLHFRTPPEASAEADVHLVALGDDQRDDGHLDKHREVLQDGVVRFARDRWDPDLAQAIDGVLIAGDLVDNGWNADDWWTDFFAPAAELASEVPFYPVLGNHEGNSPLYFRYFHLPEGGEPDRWYTVDHSNVRVVGLDSNPPFDDADQLAWLSNVLDRTCTDPTIDFVVAQLHHPHKSELWPDGESDWTGQVIGALERFTDDCGKPSVHLFGHTHAYSRGQSRDHRHLWVNVSSAGGALDRWGAEGQRNYPEFSDSWDTWGFVALEAVAGDDPSLRVSRVDRGNDDQPRDNEIVDEVTLRSKALPPDAPTPDAPDPVACEPVVLRATAFVDGDGGAHQASIWQVAASCGDFGSPIAESWRQSHDRWGGVDLQAGDDLTDEVFDALPPGPACWRVRYRDDGLSLGAWSEPAPIEVPPCG